MRGTVLVLTSELTPGFISVRSLSSGWVSLVTSSFTLVRALALLRASGVLQLMYNLSVPCNIPEKVSLFLRIVRFPVTMVGLVGLLPQAGLRSGVEHSFSFYTLDYFLALQHSFPALYCS